MSEQEVLEVSVGRRGEGAEKRQSQEAGDLQASEYHFSLSTLHQEL